MFAGPSCPQTWLICFTYTGSPQPVTCQLHATAADAALMVVDRIGVGADVGDDGAGANIGSGIGAGYGCGWPGWWSALLLLLHDCTAGYNCCTS